MNSIRSFFFGGLAMLAAASLMERAGMVGLIYGRATRTVAPWLRLITPDIAKNDLSNSARFDEPDDHHVRRPL
ncbi:hypothetical protein [Mesorhizobium sp. CAU 1732]|uniref:hypothetical protein n=1 Tax=Mesorhizobium sp. CAU 1732 TaxID=3140358 RepID=UPI0032605D6D